MLEWPADAAAARKLIGRNPVAAPLVLLPGLICDSRIFARQVARFDAQAIDGFGARSSLGVMAEHVLAVAPPRMSLLGHSMGARVALEVFRAAPERVERLALVSTGVHTVRPGEAEKRFALRDLGREKGAEALVDQWLPPMVAPERAGDVALMHALRTMCVEAGVDAFEAQVGALLDRPEVETLLPRFDGPALVAVGSLDVWSPPAQHEAIAAALPDALYRIVEGAGHMLPAEAPEALNEAIGEWLALSIAGRIPS